MTELVAIALVVPLFLLGELARWGTGRALGLAHERRFFVRFTSGPKWARAVAIGAGSLAIYLAIAIAAFVLFRVHGVATGEARTTVASTKPGFAADGKLAAGDVITLVDREPFTTLTDAVNARGGASVTLTVERDGVTREVTLQPTSQDGRWLLGIAPTRELVRRHDTGVAARLAATYPIHAIAKLATDLAPEEHAEHTDRGGPKRIVDVIELAIPFWVVVVTLLLGYGTYVLVASLVVDVVRAIRA